jgi:hypothetical protein
MARQPPPELPLFDAEGALTREYLLWRGTCCQNGCRNCPYGFKKDLPEPETPAPPVPERTGAE